MSTSSLQSECILVCILLNLIVYAHCLTTDSYSTLTTCMNETECQSSSENYELISESSTSENMNYVTEMINTEKDLNPTDVHTTKKVNVSSIFTSFYPTTTSSHSVNKLSNYSITANINRQSVPIVKRITDPCTCDFQVKKIFFPHK